MIEKIVLKKSAVEGKMPTSEQLEYGEIALNFNTMDPFISFKDTADGIRQIKDYSNEIQYINLSLNDVKNDIDYLRPLVTDNNTNLMFLRSDFEDFKTDNTKTINALDSNVAQNAMEIQKVNGIVENHTTDIDHLKRTSVTKLAVVKMREELNASIDKKADSSVLANYAKAQDLATTNASVTTNTKTLNTHTQQINTLNTKVAELEQKTPQIDLSEYAKKTDIPAQEIYIGTASTAPTTAKMVIDTAEDIMEVCPTTGTSETNVVSQKCFTDQINTLLLRIEKLERALNKA